MKITYFGNGMVTYIDQISEKKYAYSTFPSEHLTLDWDSKGELVGVEIIRPASSRTIMVMGDDEALIQMRERRRNEEDEEES